MKDKRHQFEVIIRSWPTSLDDWKRAQTAAPSELPTLNKDQKEVAEKFGLAEEQYARSYLSLLYGQERMRARAANLGKALQEILETIGQDYHLIAVVSEMDKEQWVVEIQAHEQIVDVEIPRELADDFLDSGHTEYLNHLKELLLSNLKHSEVSREQ
ncbi:MAG: hypothetical protein HYS38_00900 [Acidobacteria bacterium]|nr:hypothetical protein [Acidobacteriota bacterium]